LRSSGPFNLFETSKDKSTIQRKTSITTQFLKTRH